MNNTNNINNTDISGSQKKGVLEKNPIAHKPAVKTIYLDTSENMRQIMVFPVRKTIKQEKVLKIYISAYPEEQS